MANAVESNRKGLQRLAAQGVGLLAGQPRYTTGQQVPARIEAEIAAMPTDFEGFFDLQVTSGDLAGRFFFMLNLDPLGTAPLR